MGHTISRNLNEQRRIYIGQLEKMEFESLPVELVYSNILPFFKWNDLLKLRQVNSQYKSLIDTFIRDEMDGIPARIPILINESNHSWKNITTFVHLGFSATNFYLNNPSGHKFFDESLPITKFLSVFAAQITTLQIQRISTCPSGSELKFYDSLTNLTSLTIDSVCHKLDPLTALRENIPILKLFQFAPPKIVIPKTFENLTLLNFNRKNDKNTKQVSSVRLLAFNIAILRHCLKLREISLGLNTTLTRHSSTFIIIFENVLYHIQQRALKHPTENNLKYFSFQNFPFINMDTVREISPVFLELCDAFAEYRVRVKHVPANFFKAFDISLDNPERISSVVESLHGLHPALLRMELQNLRHLNLITFMQTSFYHPEYFPFNVSWPSLETLSLWVNTRNFWGCSRQGQSVPSISVEALIDMLFGSNQNRPGMKSLRLVFSSRMLDTFSRDMGLIPCPKVISIVSTCPNLTTLEMVNWPNQDNAEFSKLWKGLKYLQEVRLTKCRYLGDEGFIGEDPLHPEILKLKHLKSLWLLDLDKMPKITDRSFQLAFRHIKLTQFIISCEKPLKNVTKGGVSALLTGNFATSINHFPFVSWSLGNVDKADWKLLQRQFNR